MFDAKDRETFTLVRRRIVCGMGGSATAKIVFKFFQVNVPDEDVDLFLKQMEKVLMDFAGDAYHFRYEIEQSFPGTVARTSRARTNGANKTPKFKPA